MGNISSALVSWQEENSGTPTMKDLVKQHKEDRILIDKLIKGEKSER